MDTSATQQAMAAQSCIPAASATLVAVEPMVCRSRAGGKRLGRPSREALVLRNGPPVLCVLVATPEGRWHAEFTSMGSGREGTRVLCDASDVRDIVVLVMDTPAACGLAAMRAWRFVHGQAGCEKTYAMTQAWDGVAPAA